MTAQEYILSTLTLLAEPVRSEDIGDTPLEDAILAKVMSKKFRKWKADAETISVVRDAIRYAVDNNRPLQIGQLFGGNKLWRFAEAPEADWAELFGSFTARTGQRLSPASIPWVFNLSFTAKMYR